MNKLAAIFLLLLITDGCGQPSDQSTTNQSTEEVLQEKVSYSLDAFDCLMQDNSEATAQYDNGQFKSKILFWNCADYPGGVNEKKYVAIMFTSSDGGTCYKSYENVYQATPLCTSPAKIPQPAVFTAEIASFEHIYLNKVLSFKGGFTNKGNVPLWFKYTLSSDMWDESYSWHGFALAGETVPMSLDLNIYNPQPNTYVARLTIKQWDGTNIDSKDIVFTLSP